jgi:hypothetical protein
MCAARLKLNIISLRISELSFNSRKDSDELCSDLSQRIVYVASNGSRSICGSIQAVSLPH